MVAGININMEIQFGERVGHGGWLIGPKLFRPESFPTYVSSKFCEYIFGMEILSCLIFKTVASSY